jgi:hypothetical protein
LADSNGWGSWRTGGAAVDDAGAGQLALQVQDLLADLGGLAAAVGNQVLGLVALVEDDEAVKIGAAPLDQLVQAREALCEATMEARTAAE